VLEDSIGCIGGARVMVEVVVDCVALPWWWQRWPLLFGRGDVGMVENVAGDLTLPLCRGGLSG
jgi:hypothetical protein